jgi:hypothetical protein
MERDDGEKTTFIKEEFSDEERDKTLLKLAKDLEGVLEFGQRRAIMLAGFLDVLSESLMEVNTSLGGVEVKLEVGGGSLKIELEKEAMRVTYGKENFGRTDIHNSSPLRDFFMQGDNTLILIDEAQNAIGIQKEETKVNIAVGAKTVVGLELGVSS